jgi:xanthine dehydrogenase FAD-binding subunit
MFDFKELYQPKNLADALRLRKEHPDAVILAGGSDVLINIRAGKEAGRDILNIFGLDELRGISMEPDGTLVILPLTSFSHVSQSPLIQQNIPTLQEAVDQVGGPQIRNIGTIGGNICNGVTSADAATTLKAFDAILELSSVEGKRIVPYADFNKGPGKVDLRPDELLTAIKIPKESYQDTYGHYIKYAMRRAMDIATMACSANVRLDAKKQHIERMRIAYGVAAPVPVRGFTVEKVVQGRGFDQALLDDAAKAALNDVNPRTSWRASKEFRIHLIEELTRRALKTSIERAGGKFNG